MKKHVWYAWVAVALLALSALIFLVDYEMFGNAHQLYVFLVANLAFLPLSVLFVTLAVDRLLVTRDKRASIEKMNMVIGAFFSEVGTELIRLLTLIDPGSDAKREVLRVTGKVTDKDFKWMKTELSGLSFDVEPDVGSLEGMQQLLVSKRDFMVRLLENPLLLEHATFTDLLWAVFHLTEELESRPGFDALPAADMAHLAGDAARAYGHLVAQWLAYMQHLQRQYPYLFSLALRLNPFDPDASVLVV
jgi:hypothetical protein